MNSKTRKRSKVPLSPQTPSDSEWPTRVKVAEAFDCSPATVRRLEGSVLHPVLDAKNVHRFNPLEVIQVMHDRAPRGADPTREGERDARVFEMLEAGKGARDVVTTLRISAEVAFRLCEQWEEAGRRDLVVPPAGRAELENCLGPVRDVAELVERVRFLDVERERLEGVSASLTNRFGNLMSILGELAARSSELEHLLPELKRELDAEQVNAIDRSLAYHRQRLVSATRSQTSND